MVFSMVVDQDKTKKCITHHVVCMYKYKIIRKQTRIHMLKFAILFDKNTVSLRSEDTVNTRQQIVRTP